METLRDGQFPVIEGYFEGDDLHRPFTYYRQSLDGQSNRWVRLADDFAIDKSKIILGLITEKDIVWSLDAPAHMAIERALGIDDWDAKIETWSGSRPHIAIYTNDLSLQTAFRDYLLRSGVTHGEINVEGSTYKGQRRTLL